MSEELSEEEVRKALAPVKHPAIDRTLVDLGIARDIKVEGNMVLITLALPFAGVPAQIRQIFINSLSAPLKQLGAEVKFELTIMTADELQKFLAMEQEGWRGL
jgi:ATP-binding protein involved in chromosome partitioning